ncbi:hypothetical protein [Colwellia echini]|uniref:Cell division inhibitor SulA n=1 Tax=Colwellia echini TaxID=1982103 RepID=A0ABY3MYS8_9GAMM|nr:hypothetical protein [Colwellia echini]TYK66177.1 hypothetical protein CWS31_006100 [Colwellia echini]
MFSINTSNNNPSTTMASSITNTIIANQTELVVNQAWLKSDIVENHTELSLKYADICHQHNQQKKWVLFINPEESSLEQLAKTHGIDISKILCVSFKGKNKVNNIVDDKFAHLDIEQIKSVLSRGNCSAVILSNATFSADQMQALDSSARLGETHCLVLKNNRSNEISLNVH